MNKELYCPQCGEDTDQLYEGYCRDCCDENQRQLDLHNIQFNRWQLLTDQERDKQIRDSVTVNC